MSYFSKESCAPQQLAQPLQTPNTLGCHCPPSSPAQAQHKGGTHGAPKEARNVDPGGHWGLQLHGRHRKPKRNPCSGSTWHMSGDRGSCSEDRTHCSWLHTWVRLREQSRWPISPLPFGSMARQAQACEGLTFTWPPSLRGRDEGS